MEAFEAASRFIYIHTPALKLRAELHDDGQMRVVYEVAEPLEPYPLQAYEATLGLAVRFVNYLAGPDVAMTISLMHPPVFPGQRLRRRVGMPGAIQPKLVRLRSSRFGGLSTSPRRRL